MISIVIPLYNKAAVICRTMESVKQQIFSDFEILIVNDGSTDDSLSVLMDFLSENEAVFKNSVRLIEQENKGVSAARNQGIKEARGEIIAFLDADDEWLPDYLKTIAFLVEKYPECDIFGTAYSFKMNNMITPASIDYYSFKENEGILDNYFTMASKARGPIWTSAVAVRKKAILSIGCFPEGISLGEDVIVWAKLACLYKIAYSKSNLALYRRDSSCYLSVKKNMQPAIKEDYVGIELWRLNCSYQIKDLDNYVYLWYKIRFVIFVFEQRTYKRYRSKFLRVTSDNVIDIISHSQRVCIVAHRVRMKAQPERFTHFCIVYGRMRSHIQQVSKLKHIAQFGEFACDITDIVITRFTAQLRSYNKNTRIWLNCFKFANDFAHIAEERIGVILRTIGVDILDTSQRMPEHKRIVVA